MEDVGLESMFKVSSRETSDAVRTEISWQISGDDVSISQSPDPG